MQKANWLKTRSQATRRPNAPVRLAVESLETRSLLAGLPAVMAFEVFEVPVEQDFRPALEVRGYSASSFGPVRAWSAQEIGPRVPNIVIIVTPPRNVPVGGEAVGEANPGKSPGDAGGRPPFGYPFGIPNHRPPVEVGEGEPPDTLPPSNGVGNSPGSLGGRPGGTSGGLNLPGTSSSGATGVGGGLGAANGLGSSGTLGSPSTPATGLGGDRNPPAGNLGGGLGTSSNGGTSGGSSSSTPVRNDSASRDSLLIGLLDSSYAYATGGFADKAATADVDIFWTNWTQTRSDLLRSNSLSDDAAGRGASLRTLVRSTPKSETTDDDSLDANHKEEGETDADTTSPAASRLAKRELGGKRLARGFRGRPAADQDWTTMQTPHDAALDAVLAEIARAKGEADESTAPVDDDGLIEVIVAAAADAPAID